MDLPVHCSREVSLNERGIARGFPLIWWLRHCLFDTPSQYLGDDRVTEPQQQHIRRMIDAYHKVVLAVQLVVRLFDCKNASLWRVREERRLAEVVDGQFVNIAMLVLDHRDRAGASVRRRDGADNDATAAMVDFYLEFTERNLVLW